MATTKDITTVCLFDIDGTLTAPRKVITKDMKDFLTELNKKVKVYFVGGSDYEKINEQLGGEDFTRNFHFLFAENGLDTYCNGVNMTRMNISRKLGEAELKRFINYCLKYMSGLDLPCKRGTFVEFRNGMLNVCPTGRNCSQKERDEFFELDKVEKIRDKFVAELEKEFDTNIWKFSIGGQISFDAFPVGWDKTYCLGTVLNDRDVKTVHFFGDKTSKGGNDYEIFEHEKTIGHTVTSPENTMEIVSKLFP